MFQFLRRVSTSFLPRPDRPWRDDATSHAPTIGRKRRYSVTEHVEDDSPSMAKKAKNGPVSVKLDTECDSASEGSSPGTTPVEGQGVKEVTKGVKEVDLEDEDRAKDASSIPPEGVPLPDSPSPLPEAESEPLAANLEAGEETEDQKHAEDEDSVASSAPEEGAEGTEDSDSPEVAETDGTEGTTPAQDVITTTTEDDGPAETLEA